MAKVAIVQMEPFLNDKGEEVNYQRLCISGYVGGELHTLEIKLEKSELLLAKMLLSSTENKPTTVARKSSEDELNTFLDENKHNSSDSKIDLENDD